MKEETSLEEIMGNMDRQWTSMAQERRFKKQMEESGREELTRRELIGLILKIQDGIWDLSDGELEDLAEVLGLDVKCFKHGIFSVKTLDKDDD